MRSRVMPGSSPTIERRVPVMRLNSVLLPTLGRPTMATKGSGGAGRSAGTTDLRYVGNVFLLVERRPHPLPPRKLLSAVELLALPGGPTLSLSYVPLRVFLAETPPSVCTLQSIPP